MNQPETKNNSDVPQHVAIIMDGNGRWAKLRKLPRVRGHREGIVSVRKVVRAASDAGVKYLTVYAFSSENWGRPPTEVRALMGFLARFLKKEVPELKKERVRLRAIGNLDHLPPKALKTLRWAEEETAGEPGMQFILALSYGGRDEILSAVRSLMDEGVSPEELDEALFRKHLYAPDIPDPDLLIRTSGEMRISNFLLWQIAYSEIYMTDVFWPDFREEEFSKALEVFSKRERRFGLTSDQLSGVGK